MIACTCRTDRRQVATKDPRGPSSPSTPDVEVADYQFRQRVQLPSNAYVDGGVVTRSFDDGGIDGHWFQWRRPGWFASA